jgi:hypothetical protein
MDRTCNTRIFIKFLLKKPREMHTTERATIMNKKLIATVFLSCLSINAFAASAPSPADNIPAPAAVDLNVADSNGAWIFGIEALYAKTNANYTYTQRDKTVSDIDPTILSSSPIKTGSGNNWGGTATIGYIFPHTARDISLSYTYLDVSNNSSVHADMNNPQDWIRVPVMTDGGWYIYQKNAKDTLDQRLNAVDLTVGQSFHINDRVDLHPFVGLRYANIKSDNSTIYSYMAEDNWKTYNNSNFNGIGPRLGLDANVKLGAGFSIIGTAAGSLLVNSIDASTNAEFLDGDDFGPYKKSTNDTHAVTPELDAKLGLGYQHAFSNNNSLQLQVGYEAANYFNSVNFVTRNDQYSPINNNKQNFEYYGPFAKIQLNIG